MNTKIALILLAIAATTATAASAQRGRPVMIGDDAGDQTALEVAKRQGGFGLKVAGEHFSTAEADFSGPQQVRNWLAELCRRLS